MSGRRGRALAALAFPLVAAAAIVAPIVPAGAWGRFTLGLYGALSLLYVWALRGRGESASVRGVLLAGILARILLVAAPSFTSRDVERYLWDGAVLLEGRDPYRLLPSDPSLDGLRERFPPPRDNTGWPAIYPPAALALFAACAAAGPDAALWVWKAIVAAASIAALLAVDRILREEGKRERIAILALSPLVVLEGGVGAHLDLLVVLCVALGLLALRRDAPGRVGLAFGVAASLKLLPLVVVLLLATRFRRSGLVRFASCAAAAIGAPYLLAIAAGLRPLGSLVPFLLYWSFGSPLFFAGVALGLPSILVRIALGIPVLVASAILAASTHGRPAGILVRNGFAAVLLFFPVVFPWYLAVLVPALALHPSLPLLVWTLLHPLTYEVLDRYEASGTWAPAAWPLGVIAVGVVGAWIVARFRRADRG